MCHLQAEHNVSFQNQLNSKSVIYKVLSVGNRKSCIKKSCMTDVILCRVCEGGDLELPIDGVGTPAARIGTWETVRQDGGALAEVH